MYIQGMPKILRSKYKMAEIGLDPEFWGFRVHVFYSPHSNYPPYITIGEQQLQGKWLGGRFTSHKLLE